MKKGLLSLVILGAAAFSSGAVYACEDWSFNEPNCPQTIHYGEVSGKAAYGMPTQGGSASPTNAACEDWSYNEERCSAYIGKGTGSTDRNYVAPRTLIQDSTF